MAEEPGKCTISENLFRRMEERLARVVGAAQKLEMPPELKLALAAWENFCEHWQEPDKYERSFRSGHYEQLEPLLDEIHERMERIKELFE